MHMSENYRGIILSISQRDRSIFSTLHVIGKKQAFFGVVTLYKVELEPALLEPTIERLQRNMRDSWLHIRGFYCHFYRGEELIVVFKDRIFKANACDKSTWAEIFEYGKSIHTPEPQLDFSPCKIEDETY